MGDPASQKFGKYTLLRRLAVGGMAEIFLAEHRGEAGFVRQVVIKRVLPNLCENLDFVTMFLDEARLLARLTHPNVVHIYDFGRIEDQYFLSLEYVHGGNLRDVLVRQRGAPIPLGQALYVVGQALAGLDHAHRAKSPDGTPLKLVHRDVSPSNLLLSLDGAVKLADFGIARSTAQQVHTAAFVIKGKLAYMSPEQVTGRPLDGRSDVFSMGVVLWEMLTGRRLFSRESAREIQHAICVEPVPAAAALRPDLPEAVAAVVERALGRDRDERFPSAAAMQMAVDECMATCRLVGGAQHFAAYMKQIFPELADEGAGVDDNAPTVMRDPVPQRQPTELLDEPSVPGTEPGTAPGTEPGTAPGTEPGTEPGKTRPLLPVAPRHELPPGDATGPPPPSGPRALPPSAPHSAPIVLPAEPYPRPGSAPLRLPPEGAPAPYPRPPSAPLTLPPDDAPAPYPRPPSAPLTLPPDAALHLSAPEPTTPHTPLPLAREDTPFASRGMAAPAIAWLVAQWPTLAIGATAVVIGSIALWLMFSGSQGDPGVHAPAEPGPDAATALRRVETPPPAPDAATARRLEAAPRDAGLPAPLAPRRDASTPADAAPAPVAAPRADAAPAAVAAPRADAAPAAVAALRADAAPERGEPVARPRPKEPVARPRPKEPVARPKPKEPVARPKEPEAAGMLSIQARPSATAILDGRNLGETPIYRRRTPAGWHTLELRAKGLPPLKRRIQVQPNREFKRTFDLKSPDAKNP